MFLRDIFRKRFKGVDVKYIGGRGAARGAQLAVRSSCLGGVHAGAAASLVQSVRLHARRRQAPALGSLADVPALPCPAPPRPASHRPAPPDPSYMIRSIPTITTDRIYCKARAVLVGCGRARRSRADPPAHTRRRAALCAPQPTSASPHPAAIPPRLPACPQVLGQGAVHGAFAGYTDFTVGLVNT